jgi:hypothetical protein
MMRGRCIMYQERRVFAVCGFSGGLFTVRAHDNTRHAFGDSGERYVL